MTEQNRNEREEPARRSYFSRGQRPLGIGLMVAGLVFFGCQNENEPQRVATSQRVTLNEKADEIIPPTADDVEEYVLKDGKRAVVFTGQGNGLGILVNGERRYLSKPWIVYPHDASIELKILDIKSGNEWKRTRDCCITEEMNREYQSLIEEIAEIKKAKEK